MFEALDSDDVGATDRVTEDYLHAPMNYIGNKYDQLDWLLPKLPPHEIYTEVFGGSGAVLLAKRRSKQIEVFNDRYSGTAALYMCIQDSEMFDQLIELIKAMPHSRELWRWCLDTYKNAGTVPERAARYYYLVQCSYVGKFDAFARVTEGRNSVAGKITKYLPEFPQLHQRLQGVLIENKDYHQIMREFDGPLTLHYLDPPYFDNDRYSTSFDRNAHRTMCERIFQMEGAVALSGQDNDLYGEYGWDNIYINHEVSNRVNSVKGKRQDRKELLWIKEASV